MQYQVAIPLGASTCKKIPWKRTGRYVLTASPPSICEVRNVDALIDTIEDPDDNIIRLRFLPFHTPMTVFVKVKVRPAPRGGRGGGASSSRGEEVEVGGDVGGGGGDGGEVKRDAASDAARPAGEVKEGGGEGGRAPSASLVGRVETLVFKVVYADLGLPSAAEKAAEAEWGNIAECTGFSHAQVRQMHQRFIIDTRGGHAMSRAVFGRVMASLGAVVPMPEPPPPSPPPRAASDRDSGGDARADGDADAGADAGADGVGDGNGDGDGMGDRANVDENDAEGNAEDNATRISPDAASPLSVARTYTAFTAISDRRTEQLWQWFTRHGPNLTFSELAAGLAITWTQADDDADAAMALDEAERYEERERVCMCVCVYVDAV